MKTDRARGSPVLLRYVSFGHVRLAYPHRLVEHSRDRVVLFLAAGTPGKRFTGPPLHAAEDLARYDWSLADRPWRRTHRLSLTPLEAAHSLDLFWAEDSWQFVGWYVNLQAPLQPTPLGFDTRDHALDVVIAPDGSWRWKDEDHLEAAVRLGRFSRDEGAAIRREGERVIAALPRLLPTGWEEWRPDPSWALPPLPAGWDAV